MALSPPRRTLLLAVPALLAAAIPPSAAQAAPSKPSTPPTLVGWAKVTTEGVFLAGGYFPGQGWREDATARSFVFPGTPWNLFNLTGQKATISTERAEQADVPIGYFAKARSKAAPNYDAPVAVALSGIGTRNAQPRLPRPQSLQQPLYAGVAAQLLRDAGLKVKSARLSQLLRVDLDGDGVEEVLISAHSRPEYGHTPETKAGDYDLTALHFVQHGKVKTVPLEVEVAGKSVAFSAPNRSEFLACADIDGDGTMEIVLSTGYYEGFGLEVWRFDGQKVSRVLSAGWGV